MGSQSGVLGHGNLGEQIKFALKNGSTTAVLPPAVQNATVNSDAFNSLGANAILANFNVGAVVAAGNFTAKLQWSADGLAGWTDVTGSKMGFGAAATAAGAIGTANTDVQLLSDLRGDDIGGQFFRYVHTLVSGTSVLFGTSVVLGAYELLPTSAN